ncbi:hypothetical protein LOK49_LG01G00332 [Camellia lanceoleosa]|uniref:Uncharacterized protein n=1 Tax=Camellia lanceoleosa TaxID=1840588 RepID=A0ACC0J2W0_9ERIC|nr:hypothetical protein LOK49_LG01G00332 [Camellia lanceoleosa]
MVEGRDGDGDGDGKRRMVEGRDDEGRRMAEGGDCHGEGRRMVEGGDCHGKGRRMAEGRDATARRDCGHEECGSFPASQGQSEPSSALGNHSIQGVYTPQGQSRPPFGMSSNYVEGVYTPQGQSRPPFGMSSNYVEGLYTPQGQSQPPFGMSSTYDVSCNYLHTLHSNGYKEQGLNTELYYRNEEIRETYSVVPASAIGISHGILICSGNDEKGKFDELVEDKGVKILIDPKAHMHVIGTKMDFFNDKLRSEFIFINPNSKGKCGCGESFMPTSSAEAAKPVIVQDHKS